MTKPVKIASKKQTNKTQPTKTKKNYLESYKGVERVENETTCFEIIFKIQIMLSHIFCSECQSLCTESTVTLMSFKTFKWKYLKMKSTYGGGRWSFSSIMEYDMSSFRVLN